MIAEISRYTVFIFHDMLHDQATSHKSICLVMHLKTFLWLLQLVHSFRLASFPKLSSVGQSGRDHTCSFNL